MKNKQEIENALMNVLKRCGEPTYSTIKDYIEKQKEEYNKLSSSYNLLQRLP
jgi:hypothetical protein